MYVCVHVRVRACWCLCVSLFLFLSLSVCLSPTLSLSVSVFHPFSVCLSLSLTLCLSLPSIHADREIFTQELMVCFSVFGVNDRCASERPPTAELPVGGGLPLVPSQGGRR